tara:strand:+ start:181 stop:897 length:717 start_codon:yes stop_codon:yes gene_type:complete
LAKEVAIYDILDELAGQETDIHSQRYRFLLARLAKEFLEKDIYLSSGPFKDFLKYVENTDIGIFDKQLALLIDAIIANENGHERFRYWKHTWYILVADPENTDTDALENSFKSARDAAISLTTVSDKVVQQYSWANRRRYRKGRYGDIGQSAARKYDSAQRRYKSASAKAAKERLALLAYLEGLRKKLSSRMSYEIEYGSRTDRLRRQATALRGVIILFITIALGLFLYIRRFHFADV